MKAKKRKRCSFCSDRSIVQADEATGKVVAFCRDCLLIFLTKAIDIAGDKIGDWIR